MRPVQPLVFFLPSLVAASCSVFQPLTGTCFTNFTNSNTSITISEAHVCNAGTNFTCWFGSPAPLGLRGPLATEPDFLIGGIVTVNRTIGTTTNVNGSDNGIYSTASYLSDDAMTSLFSLISSSTGMTFEQNVVGNLTGSGVGFEQAPGEAGYAVFHPELDCVRGVLRGCSGDGYPQQDTAIEACAPPAPNTGCSGSYGCGPKGSIAYVSIPANQSSSVDCWPCEVELKLTGAAGKLEGDWMMIAGITMGVLVWFGW